MARSEVDVRQWEEHLPPSDLGVAIGAHHGVAAVRITHRDDFQRGALAKKVLGLNEIEGIPTFTEFPCGDRPQSVVYFVGHPDAAFPAVGALAHDLRRGAVEVLLSPQVVAVPSVCRESGLAGLKWMSSLRTHAIRPAPDRLYRFAGLERMSSPAPSAVSDRDRGLLTLDDLFDPSRDREYALAPWVPEGSITVFTGQSKTAGLTHLCLHAAAALQYGREFLGEWQTSRRVLYVSEQSQESFVSSVEASCLDTSSALRNLFVHTVDHWDPTPPETLVQNLARAAENYDVGLIVVDSVEGVLGKLAGPDGVQTKRAAELLLRLTGRRRGVLATTRLASASASLDGAIGALGPLAAVADGVTLVSEMGGAARTSRVLQSRARNALVPDLLVIDFDVVAGQFNVVSPDVRLGPLFRGERDAPVVSSDGHDGPVPVLQRVTGSA